MFKSLPAGYLSVTEVAERLGVHRETINRWELSGRVETVKRLARTNQRLYTEEDVERLRRFMQQEYWPRRPERDLA